MKKAIYLMALLALPAFANAQSDDKAKAEMKTKIVAECVDAVKAQATTDQQKKSFDEYCNCMADGLLKELTVKELEELETGTPERQQELGAKVGPIITPCMEDLQKKMGAGQ